MLPVAIPLGLAVGAAVAAPPLLKRLFAVPKRDIPPVTPADFGLDGREVWITGSRDKRLHAWFIPAPEPGPAVVVLHGWGGSGTDMLPIAPGLHDLGMHALFLDARTHGQSDQEDFMSMPRFAEDLETALGWLEAREDVTSIGVIGHSVGASASILAASRGAPIDAVVAVAAFAHPEELLWRNIPYPAPVKWSLLRIVERMIGVSFDEIAPRNRIGEVQIPVLLIHGELDSVVPSEDALSLQAHQPECELLVVPGAGHSDLAAFQPYFPDVEDFLRRSLK